MKPSTLHERIAIAAPLNSAPCYLERFFTERRTANGNTIALHLILPGLPQGIAPEHNTLATFVREGRWNGWNDSAGVSWRPDGGGSFPTFRGENEDPRAYDDYNSWWAIDGSYVPPGGAVGRVFDASVGHAIARATAHELLTQLKAAIERFHVDEERAKQPASSPLREETALELPGKAP